MSQLKVILFFKKNMYSCYVLWLTYWDFQDTMSKPVAGMETESIPGSDARRVGLPAYKATDALR